MNTCAVVRSLRVTQNDESYNPDQVYGDTEIKWLRTVCDLTASSIVGCAVGFDRYEELKRASSAVDNMGFPVLKDGVTGDGSQAYIFQPGSSQEQQRYRDALKEWMDADGAGAAQFKFGATSGWHTFMVCKVQGGSTGNFVVYQSYQGTYRLSDFLGEANDTYVEVGKKTKALAKAVDAVGKHKLLNRQQFEQLIVEPFALGLDQKLTPDAYQIDPAHSWLLAAAEKALPRRITVQAA